MTRSALAILLTVSLGVGAVPSSAANEPSGASEEAWTTAVDLEIVETVILALTARVPDLPAPTEWTAIGSFSSDWPETYEDRLPTTDGWGREFRVGRIGDAWVVVSAGPDGRFQAIERSVENGVEVDLGSDRDDPAMDDLVLVVGDGVMNRPLTERDRMRAAMADMRSIGTAIESYAIDQDVYPTQTAGLRDLRAVRPILSPVYIRDLPMRDPWGHEFLYWSDSRQYILVSPGTDGILDRPYDVGGPALDDESYGPWVVDSGRDLVFINGQFRQWPEGVGW